MNGVMIFFTCLAALFTGLVAYFTCRLVEATKEYTKVTKKLLKQSEGAFNQSKEAFDSERKAFECDMISKIVFSAMQLLGNSQTNKLPKVFIAGMVKIIKESDSSEGEAIIKGLERFAKIPGFQTWISNGLTVAKQTNKKQIITKSKNKKSK